MRFRDEVRVRTWLWHECPRPWARREVLEEAEEEPEYPIWLLRLLGL